MKLRGRTALVTGAAGGLGRAIAMALAREGAHVAICDINPEGLATTRELIAQNNGKCTDWICDVSDRGAVDLMFEGAAQISGQLDILVNNAALVPNQPADTARRNRHYGYLSTSVPRQSLGFTSAMSDADWHRYWDVNVHGLFYCTRAALRLMEPRRYGRIINIASIAGMSSMSAHSPHYSATKGAVIAFTKSVAAEVAGANIYVNAMAPGGVATPEFSAYLDAMSPEQRNQLWQMVPAGRFGTMEEYAETVLHLAGEHYLVGQIISPNGGAVI